ncbi:MAG: hypothetical protein ACRC68_16425, partial [Clostridium sp.]
REEEIMLSRIVLIIGIVLIIIEFIFKFDGILGYSVTTLGTLLSLYGIVTNKKIRYLVGEFICNFL